MRKFFVTKDKVPCKCAWCLSQEEKEMNREGTYSGTSTAGLASSALNQPVGKDAAATIIIRDRLVDLLKVVAQRGHQLQTVADRNFGSMPEKAGQGRGEKLNCGTIAEIYGLVDDIQATLDYVLAQIQRIERL